MTFRLPNGFAGSVNNVVTTCSATDAANGACTGTSQLGSVSVRVGTGAEYVTLAGTVHLTTAASNELAKLVIQVPATVGPFNLGTTVIYATMALNSQPTSASTPSP